MRILFLDDDLNRIKIAKELFIGHALYTCETVFEAYNLLDDYPPFDVISLDHDLGGEVFCASDEKSGYAVAQHIVEKLAYIPALIVVHSYNPVGADNMFNILAAANFRVVKLAFNSFVYQRTMKGLHETNQTSFS